MATHRIDFGRGDDPFRGEAGNDCIYAGRGDDTLGGGDGDDLLNGSSGRDVLTGGSGSDAFQFRGAYGLDVITDFGADDCLQIGQSLNGLHWDMPEALRERATVNMDGAFLDLGAGCGVRLVGLDAAALDLVFGRIDLI